MGVGTGAIFSPFLIGKLIDGSTDFNTAAKVGIYAATAPISLLLSAITVLITAALSVSEEMDYCNNGDLTTVSESED